MKNQLNFIALIPHTLDTKLEIVNYDIEFLYFIDSRSKLKFRETKLRNSRQCA